MSRSLPTPPDRPDDDVILRFVNHCVHDVSVVWVDYAGREVSYATLKPKGNYAQGEYWFAAGVAFSPAPRLSPLRLPAPAPSSHLHHAPLAPETRRRRAV